MRIKNQRGMTLIGGMIALGSAAYILYSVVIMIFIHMEHLKIVSALNALHSVHHVTRLSEEEIRSNLRKNLNNNNIYDKELERYTKGFKIVVGNSELNVNIQYNITYKLIFGFSLTRHYEDKVSIVAN